MLKQYQERKAKVEHLLDRFIGLAERLREPALAESGRRRRERLRSGQFCIAVVSEFSNGKSTLINALLGTDLLPTHRRPFTATVIKITYGDSPEVSIRFKGGRQAVSTPADSDLSKVLNHYCTTLSDDSQDVEEVVIRYPIPLCRDGVVLMDTPGLESIYDPHEKITKQILPQADAVLFIVEAGKIGKLTDLKLIQQLRFMKKNYIFIALNKIDQLPTVTDVKEAAKELREMLGSVIEEPRVLPVSGLYALQARLLREGHVTPGQLARDRRIIIPEGDGHRPVRSADDWVVLESLGGLSHLEQSMSRFLQSGERATETLKGGCLHVIGHILDSFLPNLRRLKVGFSRAAAGTMTVQADKALEEVRRASQRLEGLFDTNEFQATENQIWDEAIERRIGPGAIDRLLDALERTLHQRGIRVLDDADEGQIMAAVEYAVKKLSAEAAEDLQKGWGEMMGRLRRHVKDMVQETTRRVDGYLNGEYVPADSVTAREAAAARDGYPAFAQSLSPVGELISAVGSAVSWPAGLVVSTIGGLLGRGGSRKERQRRELRLRLQSAVEEALAEARRTMADLHAKYASAVRNELSYLREESFGSLEANVLRLKESLTKRAAKNETTLKDLEAYEADARALLEEAKKLMLEIDRGDEEPTPVESMATGA